MSYASNPLDGTRISFEDDGGAGAPVVIHGGFLDPVPLVRRAPLAVALRPFSDEFRTVFVDHRGHGRSDKPHEASAYAMPLRAADAVSVLDVLEIEAAHFIGLSWGARLGFGIGHHARDRVLSLVLIGQHPYPIDPTGPLTRLVGDALTASRTEGIQALVQAFESIVGRYPDDVRAHYLACDAAAMRAAWTAALAEGEVASDLSRWSDAMPHLRRGGGRGLLRSSTPRCRGDPRRRVPLDRARASPRDGHREDRPPPAGRPPDPSRVLSSAGSPLLLHGP